MQISVFSPNAGKYGPEKLRIRHFLCRVHQGKIEILFLFWSVFNADFGNGVFKNGNS